MSNDQHDLSTLLLKYIHKDLVDTLIFISFLLVLTLLRYWVSHPCLSHDHMLSPLLTCSGLLIICGCRWRGPRGVCVVWQPRWCERGGADADRGHPVFRHGPFYPGGEQRLHGALSASPGHHSHPHILLLYHRLLLSEGDKVHMLRSFEKRPHCILLLTYLFLLWSFLWVCQVPLVIFKREKEVARKLEFDGLYVTEQPSEDDIRGQWDRLVINTP